MAWFSLYVLTCTLQCTFVIFLIQGIHIFLSPPRRQPWRYSLWHTLFPCSLIPFAFWIPGYHPEGFFTKWLSALSIPTDPLLTPLILITGYFAGVILSGALFTIQALSFYGEIQIRSTPVPQKILSVFHECLREFPVGRPVTIRTMPLLRTPCIAGMVNPILLLPADCHEVLTPEELRVLILHQLHHIQKKHFLLFYAVTAFRVFHWFNPVIWHVCSEIFSDQDWLCNQSLEQQQQIDAQLICNTFSKVRTLSKQTPAPMVHWGLPEHL